MIDIKQHTYVMNGVFDEHKGLQHTPTYNLIKSDHYIECL
jgi:hypothetical protein